METFRFGGISMIVRTDLPQLAIGELTVEPGVVAPPHRYQGADEVFIGLEGLLHVTIDGHTVALGHGDIATATGGQAHGFATSPEAAARVAVIFAPGGFLGFFRDAASAHDADELEEVAHRWAVEPG